MVSDTGNCRVDSSACGRGPAGALFQAGGVPSNSPALAGPEEAVLFQGFLSSGLPWSTCGGQRSQAGHPRWGIALGGPRSPGLWLKQC